MRNYDPARGEREMQRGKKILALAFVFALLLSSRECRRKSQEQVITRGSEKESLMKTNSDAFWAQKRGQMVDYQIEDRGVADPLVLDAMRKVPRHLFVPENIRADAYNDYPLPIGRGQTISQPYIVAFMTKQLKLKGGEKVLEIGTGSGYQAAVLAKIAGSVYTIDIICELADSARERLNALGYQNISVRCADGYQGWPEHAPFDAIIVTAAPEKIPQPLIDQLKPGGTMIIPVGSAFQELIQVQKLPDGKLIQNAVLPVRFVPMRGEAEKDSQ